MTRDRDHSGTDPTVAAPAGVATDATVAAGSTGPAVDVTGETVARDAGATTARTVGDELKAVTLDSFGAVDRDRFELLGELARGGLGRVFRARDPRTGRIVALKEVLRPSRDIVLRFAREAMVTANLQHPSIIPVYEVGRWKSGEPFYAMKLVRGRALDALIAEALTPEARVGLVPHVIDVADALAYAHSEHVIHRDLKPANVLVGSYGETVVIDWGIARNLVTDDGPDPVPTVPPRRTVPPGQTAAGTVIGTPAYMPPEQARGKLLDERADVYAIGAILYHVLSGVRPYAEHRMVDAILDAVEAGPPRALAELAPGVPGELIAIADKAMARAPAERYPTAAGLADDLRRFQAGQLVGAHQYTTWELVRRWVARRRATVLTAAVAVLALVVFGVIGVRHIAAERDEAQRQRARADRAARDADGARALAERRFGDSLEALGRQAALAGAPDRALPFLLGAGHADASLPPARQVMLGQALDAFAGLVGVAPAHAQGTVSADLADGNALLVTTGADRALRAWDLAAHHPAWEATGVHHAAASPDGRWILGAGDGGAISLRAAHDGAVHKTWTLAGGAEGEQWIALAWSPAGDRFALGSNRGRIAVGSPEAEALAQAAPHAGELWTVAFAPGGGALATVGADGVLAIRDPATGAVRAKLAAPGGTVACAWVDAARLVSVDNDGGARLWRVADRAVLRRFEHGADPYGLAVDPGGDWLLTYGDRAQAKLWELGTGALRAALPGHHLAVYAAVAAGPHLVTSDESGGLLVWDPATGALVKALPVEGAAPGLIVRGDRLVAFGDARQRVWRLGFDRPLRRIDGHQARVRDLVFDARGQVVWTASNDDSARGTDLATGRVVVLGEAGHREPVIRAPLADPATQPPSPHGLRALALSPDGALVVTAAEDGTLALWDAATGARRGDWRGHTGRVRAVAFAHDGATAWSVGDSTLRRWEVASGRETARAELGELAWDLAVFAGEAAVATFTDEHRTVAVWDATTLAARGTSAAGPDSLRELVAVDDRVLVADPERVTLIDARGAALPPAAFAGAFAADLAGPPGSRRIAIGNSLGEIAIFDGALQQIRRWRLGDAVVAALAYRPDGKLLAAATGNRVRLWDPASGRLLAESPEVPAMLSQLAWSPDGTRLAFGGGSGAIWVWELGLPAIADPDRFARCVSPWRLDDSALSTAAFDPTTCDALPR